MGKTPSGFVPLDMNYLRDPAVRKAGPDAELLYVRSLAHCKSGGTDGFIGDYDLEVVGVGLKNPSVRARAALLVREGLWSAEPDGWTIRSWLKWNMTQTEIADDKARKRESAIETNHKRYHGKEPDARCAHCKAIATPIGIPNATAITTPIAREEKSESESQTELETETQTETETQLVTSTDVALAPLAAPAKRATRLPADWIPSKDAIEQIKREFGDDAINFEAEHRVFTDFWLAAAGAKGVKLDWDATWRNWMRRVAGSGNGAKARTVEQRATKQIIDGAMQRAMERDAARGES